MDDVFKAVLRDEKLLLARGSGYDRGGAGLHCHLRLSDIGGGGVYIITRRRKHDFDKRKLQLSFMTI